jgi:hypothetical protein
MLYGGQGNNKLNVFLFTSRNIITVQIREKVKHGKGLNADIQNIIQELLSNDLACSVKCRIGFLCSKGKGYQESSAEHFIGMNTKDVCCHTCGHKIPKEDLNKEKNEACRFWTNNHEQVSQLNTYCKKVDFIC